MSAGHNGGGAFGVGAELDVGEFFLRFAAGLDEWNDREREWERQRMAEAARRATTPADIHLTGAVIVGAAPSPSTTRAIIIPQGPSPSPDQGHVWLVRGITVARGDVDLQGSSLGGTAWVFIGPPPVAANIATLSAANGLRDSLTAMPATKAYTGRQLVVKAEEWIYVVITGGTQNQQAYLDIVVEDYQERASAASFEV